MRDNAPLHTSTLWQFNCGGLAYCGKSDPEKSVIW